MKAIANSIACLGFSTASLLSPAVEIQVAFLTLAIVAFVLINFQPI